MIVTLAHFSSYINGDPSRPYDLRFVPAGTVTVSDTFRWVVYAVLNAVTGYSFKAYLVTDADPRRTGTNSPIVIAATTHDQERGWVDFLVYDEEGETFYRGNGFAAGYEGHPVELSTLATALLDRAPLLIEEYRQVRLPRCTACEGHGYDADADYDTCKACAGTGRDEEPVTTVEVEPDGPDWRVATAINGDPVHETADYYDDYEDALRIGQARARRLLGADITAKAIIQRGHSARPSFYGFTFTAAR
jgi:hypothetical protein